MSFKNSANLPTLMIAHILYKAIDNKVPATLSKKIVENILR